jgi:hypothetical protein
LSSAEVRTGFIPFSKLKINVLLACWPEGTHKHDEVALCDQQLWLFITNKSIQEKTS